MTFKINAAQRLKATQIDAGIKDELVPLLSSDEKAQIDKWVKEKHPDLDDNVKLRNKLCKLLKTELNLDKTPEPYNVIIDFLKKKFK